MLRTRPLNLYHIGIQRVVPIPRFFEPPFPLVSIATIFPLRRLVVQQLGYSNEELLIVLALDDDCCRNGSATDLLSCGLFTAGTDGEYRHVTHSFTASSARLFLSGVHGWPSVLHSGVGKRTLLQGHGSHVRRLVN